MIGDGFRVLCVEVFIHGFEVVSLSAQDWFVCGSLSLRKSSAGKLTYYEGQGEMPYFQSSGDTFFSTQLLQHTHEMLVSANASFTALAGKLG